LADTETMREESDNIIPVRGERITREDARNRSSERPTASGERVDEEDALQQQIAASNAARGGVGFQSRSTTDPTWEYIVTVSKTHLMPSSATIIDESVGQYSSTYTYRGELKGKNENEVRGFIISKTEDGGITPTGIKPSAIDSIKRLNKGTG